MNIKNTLKAAAVAVVAAITLSGCFTGSSIEIVNGSCSGTTFRYKVRVTATLDEYATRWRVASSHPSTFPTGWATSGSSATSELYYQNQETRFHGTTLVTNANSSTATPGITVYNPCN